MIKPFLTFCILIVAFCASAQHTRQLIGKSYENLNTVKGFEHYKPVKGYNVFDEMVCYRYQDTVNFQELMIFERTKEVKGQLLHTVADVLKVDGANRYKILSVGWNKFSAYSEKNIIIAIEDVDISGNYVLPAKSRTIYSAYTLEHKGYKFIPVPLDGLYRIGEEYFKVRSTAY